MSDILEGRCLCGAVKIRVDGAHDPRPGACHCRMCQRWTGGLFLCFEADAEAVVVEGPAVRYQSSAFAERAFCSTCGSHLWMRDVDKDGAPYDLMPGLFDAALSWPLRSEIYADRAMASVRLEGDHKRATRDEWEAQNPFIDGDV
ncbi:GFA family protein (plasmid) [Leisingera sp. M527]|uniref:GFA family protein n=1 Tax=unclassified Leisingera TaxID=2614906 RepID=UPI0021A85AE0|nr:MULTISPECIES: GFA family protein [unclassified Leisingera]UWQ35275.1 GFA family protein [Leisingera sp. M527]UWQ77281.1 GFA family protein [Leisingera sp. M658]